MIADPFPCCVSPGVHSKFSRWNTDGKAEKGTEQYYATQLYDNGAKCWNGPNRSVKVRRQRVVQ